MTTATANLSPAQQQFIDDELLRVPMVADQVLDATLLELQEAMIGLRPQERAALADLLQAAQSQRARLVARFAESVREEVQSGTAGVSSAAGAPPLALSLLDEDEVAADVEISRAIEAIESEAEHELRELATFTAALAGDMDVSRDHNPLGAETYAQAMWDAAQALTLGRGYQVLLMRHACVPLSQVLRKSYAGACARLESMGIEPAAYRTVILHAGARVDRGPDTVMGVPPDLARIRESMPWARDAGRTSEMPLDRVLEDAERALRALPQDAPPTIAAQLLEAQRPRLVRHAGSAVNQQVIELLGRLFEAMLSDERVSRDIRSVLARMQPTALRFLLRHPQALEDYAHPVWRFMDEVAYAAALHPDRSAGRDEILRLAEALVQEMSRDSAPDTELYQLALSRLSTDGQTRLKRRIEYAATDIAALQAIEKRLAEGQSGSLPTGTGALDASQLDTVPADLLDNLPPPRGDVPDAVKWLDERRAGDWVRMFVQGRWIRAQLLWQGRRGDVWLFGQGQTSSTFALRRRALERLHAEGLLTPLQVRSMLRSAAVKLARAAGQAGG